jgi:alpha-galactosidase
MVRKKLVLVGAGSSMFTQGLVMDMIRNPGAGAWSLHLVDVDEHALSAVGSLVAKMLKAGGSDIALSLSTDRREALPGADIVVATIGVGGRRAWEHDVLIPRRYGVFQPVGDTAMPGGISRTMRMVPAMVEIARDVARLCPRALFINYSNPMTNICRAVRKATGVPMTGLCIGVEESVRFLASVAGVDRSTVTYRAAGLNHLTFIYGLRHDGEDLMPLVQERWTAMKGRMDRAQIGAGAFGPEASAPWNHDPFGMSFLERHGVFPAPGDRHTTEFFTDRFPSGSYYGKVLGKDAYSFEKTIEYGDRIYAEAARIGASAGPLPDGFLSTMAGEQEQLMEIINAMERDERKAFSTNVPNRGAVPNLPDEAILEIPSLATADGFLAVSQPDFPDAWAGVIMKFIGISEVAVEAALKGNRKLFAEAILMGGYLADETAVSTMVEELLAAHAAYLPQF